MVRAQTLLDAMDGIALVLDADLRVVAGGWTNWSTFWRANGGAAPVPLALGSDITLAFSKGPVRCAFRAALQGVLRGERPPLRLAFRCDSPRVLREMHLTVTRCGGDRLLYHARLLAERPWPARLSLVPQQPERRCGVCARVQMPAVTVPDGAAALQPDALDWSEPVSPPQVPAEEPDLCPRCHLALAATA